MLYSTMEARCFLDSYGENHLFANIEKIVGEQDQLQLNCNFIKDILLILSHINDFLHGFVTIFIILCDCYISYSFLTLIFKISQKGQ